jgi:hypothetical protein
MFPPLATLRVSVTQDEVSPNAGSVEGKESGTFQRTFSWALTGKAASPHTSAAASVALTHVLALRRHMFTFFILQPLPFNPTEAETGGIR